MITISDIIKEVSQKTHIDQETVDTVCRHVFEYTVQIMKGEDTKDILFNGLLKFKLKRRYFENKNKQNEKE